MKLNDILNKLGLELGMKVIDTKPDPMIENYVYTLVKKNHNILVFENSDGWFFQVIYVLTQLGTRFKEVEVSCGTRNSEGVR